MPPPNAAPRADSISSNAARQGADCISPDAAQHSLRARPGKRPPRLSPASLALIVLGAAGFFFGMPNAAIHLPLLALLYPCCLYLLARQVETGRDALLKGWLLGLCANTAGLYWMVYPMHDVAGVPFVLAAPAVLLLFSYFACYAALTAYAAWSLPRLFTGGGLASHLAPPLLAGLAFAGFEVWCGCLFTGFPWLSLATAFGFSPLWLQAASLIGGFGLSAAVAASACLAAEGMLAAGPPRRAAFALAAALLAALPLYGLSRLITSPEASIHTSGQPTSQIPGQATGRTMDETSGERPLSAVMVQGNIDQNQKWAPAFQKGTLDLYMRLSREALADYRSGHGGETPDLLLWPETAMPFYFDLHPEYAEAMFRFAAEEKIHLAFGSLGIDRAEGSPAALKNRLYLLSSSGRKNGYYDKRHLVPFGEYTPFAADIPFLRELLQGLDFSSGAVTEPLRIDRNGVAASLGVLICYEAIFPSLAQERVEHGADVLVNVSNDGWFRDSSAPRQHLAHVTLRAVEQERPVLRATNTGFTVVVDAFGRVEGPLPALFAETARAVTVHPSSERTVYHRLHPLPEILLAALALFALFGYRVRLILMKPFRPM